MALRGLAQRLLARPLLAHAQQQQARHAQSAFSSSAAPTVFDKMVQFFVIDKDGTRHTVAGLEGAKLSVALAEHGGFPGAAFLPHPYDPAYTDCHVYIGFDYLDKLAALDEEQQLSQARLLEDFARARARANSRLGYYIPLTPALAGMTVALGEIEPWQTC